MDMLNKFKSNYKNINKKYNYLINKTQNNISINDLINVKLIDNFSMLYYIKNDVWKNLKNILNNKKSYYKMYPLLKKIVIKNNYNLDFEYICKKINQEQYNKYFSYEELNSIKYILYFIYFEKLNLLYNEEVEKINNFLNINNLIKDKNYNQINIELFNINKIINNKFYIYEVNKYINKIDNNKLYKEFNNILNKNNIILKDLINEVDNLNNKFNLLIDNIFISIDNFNSFDISDLYDRVSYTEKEFEKDYVFNKLDKYSKIVYRDKFLRSKPKNIDEVNYLSKINKKYKFIGDYLFKFNNYYNIYYYIYLICLFIITFLFDYVFSDYFLNNKYLSIIILFLPILYLINIILNRLYFIFFKNKKLLKLNVIENNSMFLIYEIINNKETIDLLFDKLESYYLLERLDNLYFTLMGDVNLEENYNFEDDDLTKYGQLKALELNKKYNKNIFYFVFKRRSSKINKSNYLWYFNNILLNKINEDYSSELFNINMLFNNTLNIKYLIILNSSNPFYNTFSSLIGAMEFYLNKPVLKDNKVISGYGVLSVNLNNSYDFVNRSYYNKLTKDIKLFNLNNEFNFTLFDSVIFNDNGIYDVMLFDNVFKNEFEYNNIIFSNKLRCGFLSDVVVYRDSDLENYNVNLIKNKFNFINLFKILNIYLSSYYYIFLFIVLITGLFFSNYYILWLIFSFLYFIIINYINGSNINKLFTNSIIMFIELPYNSFKFLNIKNKFNFFIFNIVFSLLLFIIFLFTNKNIYLILSLIFSIGYILIYLLKFEIRYNNKINKNTIDKLDDISYKSYLYFNENLIKEYNYLIPYNYQENREEKLNLKTTPSSIGFSLLSLICAYHLKYDSLEIVISKIKLILTEVKSLEKWNGHLYSFYDIKNKSVSNDRFVDSLNSSLFISCLIVTREFLVLNNKNNLVKICDDLISNTDFSKLINNNYLSYGYHENIGKLSDDVYDNFISNNLLGNYISIIKGDVNSSYWFNLKRRSNNKFLLGINGSLSEFVLFNLFINIREDDYIFKDYKYFIKINKNYVDSINKLLPWGISSASYDEVDNTLSYKVNNFGINELSIKNINNDRLVISPYSSIGSIGVNFDSVYKNINKFKNLDMYGKYGFYDAYDFKNKSVVKSYYADHLGVELVAITNYLKDNIIKEYFNKNTLVSSFINLFKYDFNNNIVIKKSKNLNKIYKDNYYRNYNSVSKIPEWSLISNKKQVLLINDRGNSISKNRNIFLSKYRNNNKDYGLFVYIKDLTTNKIFSNTFSPINKTSDKYEVNYYNDKIEFIKSDDNLVTKSEIIISNNKDIEIRKITLINNSNINKEFEVTTYMEVMLSNNNFNNNFNYYSEVIDSNCIFIRRDNYFVFNKLFNFNNKYYYETEKTNFIGNGDISNPEFLNKDLNNFCGIVDEPIISLRNKISIKANNKKSFYIINGFSRGYDGVKDIINKYNSIYSLEREFNNKLNNNNHFLNNKKIAYYNKLINYLYYDNYNEELLRKNTLGRSSLLKFGITLDKPLIVIEIKDISNINFIIDIIRAFEYLKKNLVILDILIINSIDNYSLIENKINNEIYKMNINNSFFYNAGNIILINSNLINKEEKNLLLMVSKINFINSNNLEEEIDNLDKYNTKYLYNFDKYKKLNDKKSTTLANFNFGSIVLNNGSSFTYFDNYSDYKISSFDSDYITEGFKINNKLFVHNNVSKDFGYINFSDNNKDYNLNLLQFVSLNDNVKVYLLDIYNKSDNEEVSVEFFINPILGDFEENCNKYIINDFVESDNYLKLKNVFNSNYNINAFISSSNKIDSVITNDLYKKSIISNIKIGKEKSKKIIYLIGVGKTDSSIKKIINKYINLSVVNKELSFVKSYWANKLDNIKLKSNNKYFDEIINGDFIYDIITNKFLTKINGGISLKEESLYLMNLIYIDSDYVKERLIERFKYQFEEGDFLKWNISKNMIGLRNQNNIDFIWLFYLLINYIKVTGDFYILKKDISFINGELLRDENDNIILYNYSKKRCSLINHLILGIDYIYKKIDTIDIYNKVLYYNLLIDLIEINEFEITNDYNNIILTLKDDIYNYFNMNKNDFKFNSLILASNILNKDEKELIINNNFIDNYDSIYTSFYIIGLFKNKYYDVLNNVFNNVSLNNKLYFYISFSYILGLNINKNIFNINPNIYYLSGYKLIYKYKDTFYNIEFIISDKEELILDGKVQNNKYINLINDKENHFITINLSKDTV